MKGRLTPNHHAIIDHIGRYRIATPDALERECFSGLDLGAIRKLLGRLVQNGYLIRRDLFETNTRHFYWTLSAEGAQELGINGYDFTKPIGPQALGRDYALLALCTLHKKATLRQRLTLHEVNALWPDLQGVDRYAFYRIENKKDLRPHYGFARVVHRAQSVRAINRTQQIARALYQHPELADLIDDGRFRLTLLVGHEPKKKRLDEESKKRTDKLLLKPFVVVIEQLRRLVW